MLAWRYIQSAVIICLERFIRCFWLPLFALAALLTLAISPILSPLPELIKLGVWVFALTSIFYSAIRNAEGFSLPSPRDIWRRIEQENKIAHRVLSSPANQPLFSGSNTLWAKHKERQQIPTKAIAAPKFKTNIAAHDPYALRGIVILAFICTIWMQGGKAPQNLHASMPDIAFNLSLAPDFTIQIIPPDYTNLEPRIIDTPDDLENIYRIPEGTKIITAIKSRFGTPSTHHGAHNKARKMLRGEPSQYTQETVLNDGNQYSISQFLIPRLRFHYSLIPDTPPEISLNGEPEAMPDGQLKIPLMIKDDYGVKTLKMTMRLAPSVESAAPFGYEQSEIRSVKFSGVRESALDPLYDFSANPWAGLPALVTLSVEDHKRQIAKIDDIQIILPQRSFYNPAAQLIIDIRQRLIWEGVSPYNNAQDIRDQLFDILARPQQYRGDTRVFLALRSAISRLFYTRWDIDKTAQAQPELGALIKILWDIALKIEDGNLSLAARELRDLRQQLENALNDPDTPDHEIAKIMESLQRATAEYMTEMAKELAKRIQDGDNLPFITKETLQTLMTPDLLHSFLQSLQDKMQRGDRNTARQMLSELQRFMDQLSPNISMPVPEDIRMMQQALADLNKLIAAQEKLTFQTFDFIREGKKLNPTAQEQESLRLILGELMLKSSEVLDDIPRQWGDAEGQMRIARDALEQNKGTQAIPHQSNALEFLKEGEQAMREQMQNRMEDYGKELMSMMGQIPAGTETDPLGRPVAPDNKGKTPGQNSDVEIPDMAERKKAREIIEEIRRRTGQRQRSAEELDYLRRLLQRF